MTAAQTVFHLLESTRRPLRQISRDAEVSYAILCRWVKSGGTNKYDVESAERVYTVLTGKTFIENTEDDK